MPPSLFRVALLCALVAGSALAQPAKTRELAQVHAWTTEPTLRLRHGDDPSWARPDLDDSGWETVGASELPARDGVYWVRARITLPEAKPGEPFDALAVATIAAYEVFWDGRKLGHSGLVGADSGSEIPGPLDQVFNLPPASAAPSEHLVAFRLSSFHTGVLHQSNVLIFGPTTQREYYTTRSRAAAYSVVIVGGAFVLGVFNVLLGLLVRLRVAPLLFGLMCLAGAAMQFLQSLRLLLHYPYSWHSVRILACYASVAVFVLLLVAFVIVFLRLRRPGWWVAGLAVVAALIPLARIPDAATNLALLGGIPLLVAVGHAAWAVRRGEPRAWIVLLGLLGSLVALGPARIALPDQLLVQVYGPALAGCLIALTLQLGADRRAALEARVTATRLELELLKKNIQPHFLFNTLTTLIELIEQEPRVAVGMIEALASEFRLLARMAGERLVPLRQELELCREHLRVISLRQDVRYSLRTENLAEGSLVPPALFLTLIENGVTHARQRGGIVEFGLRRQLAGDVETYVFTTPLGSGRNGAREPGDPARAGIVEGTGSRYIKARLEETFPGRWKFVSGPVPTGWETSIELSQRSGSRIEA